MLNKDSKVNFKVRGEIVSGKQEAGYFMSLTWVRTQCTTGLGFEPYPGTLNVRVNQDILQVLKTTAKDIGFRLVPEAEGFCDAYCLELTIGGYAGAVVFPNVSGCYSEIVEVIGPVKFKEALGVKDGDEIEITVMH